MRSFIALTLLILAPLFPLQAQDRSGEFVPGSLTVRPPYAGKYEARIGGSYESHYLPLETEGGKLRLDIGGSVDIYRVIDSISDRSNPSCCAENWRASFGADFFTWTRLRSSGGFKFPVEAVDYYFGVNGAYASPDFTARLRLAHISAHLVDGDPSFTDTAQRYITYSREFVDLTVALEKTGSEGSFLRKLGRYYAGLQWLFHTIPDTLGRLIPYAGLETGIQLLPWLTLVTGYEIRLNTELEPVVEHQLRIGWKVGTKRSRGALVEAAFYSGRSHYGQHFNQREKYFSLGFGVEF